MDRRGAPSGWTGPFVVPVVLAAMALTLAFAPAGAQSVERWNDATTLDLVRRARELRRSTAVDADLRSYQSEARGYVYFFIDRPDSDERTLVKADQIALEVFWQAPNRTKQRIVGLRDQKVLPTNIRYHLDHLTVVQDDFGDAIRLGDGDEVAAVLHPTARGSEEVYDFLLADSLTVRYGGGNEEVRVYEIRVRPRDPDAPGFIGSIYLDRATAAIVRMNFTFTPASYVDDHLDYIRIALDNSLWMGRFWLPYRQEVELRRELPLLDFLAGSIIRGRFEIGRYDFNSVIPPTLFLGRGVVAAPTPERESFPFERGLFDDLDERGLAPTPSLEQIREQARQMVTGRALSGLAPLRLHFRSVSDGVRYNRAEGLYLGGGLNLRPSADALLRVGAGYAFGRDQPSLSVAATGEAASIVPVVHAYWDELRDVGPMPGASGVVSTLGALITDRDFLDPYFARGLHLTLRGPRPERGPSLTLRWEQQRSARAVVDGSRSVRPIEEGILGTVELSLPFGLPGGGNGRASASLNRHETRTYTSLRVRAQWAWESPESTWNIVTEASAGATGAEAPAQAHVLLGGRGTLPGYAYRSFTGRHFALARVEATRPLLAPWVGVRLFASAGWTHLADGSVLPSSWNPVDSDGIRTSVGAGLALGWDVLRLDLARGLRDGRWELFFSVAPRFHPWL